VLERLKKPIQTAVRDSGLSISDIDKCILIGGSCNMPVVQDFLGNLLRVPISSDIDMDKAVAEGLGVYVGIKQRADYVRDLVLTDICPFSLNIDVHNPANPSRLLCQTIIPRNTPLPASRTMPFFTLNKGQLLILVSVNQGENMYADENIKLGSTNINVPYNSVNFEQIDVTFNYDINAILEVTVKSVSTGKTKRLILTGMGMTLSENQIEQYLKNIQSMKLAHNEKIDLLHERAKRIFAESHEGLKEQMQQIVFELGALSAGGSIRKTNKVLDEIEKFLDEIEAQMNENNIFREMPIFMRLIKGGLNSDEE
jgi:molecular chaperone HscC